MAKTVLLSLSNNAGYSPEQVGTAVTLSDLLEAVQQAITEFGADATIVTFDGGNRYGANFGALATEGMGDLVITDANPDDEDDESAGSDW